MESFIRRMQHYVSLSEADFAPWRALPSKILTFEPGQRVVAYDQPVHRLFVIEDGWALRTRHLPDGRRQVISVLSRGEFFDLMSLVGGVSDHSIEAARPLTLRAFDGDDVLALQCASSKLHAAFLWLAVREEAKLRAQIVRIGRMSARERIANFIMELDHRQSIALSRSERESATVELPLPQSVIADALGLSIVHVSRTLSALKRDGLLEADRRSVTLLDREEMRRISGFEPMNPKPAKLPFGL